MAEFGAERSQHCCTHLGLTPAEDLLRCLPQPPPLPSRHEHRGVAECGGRGALLSQRRRRAQHCDRGGHAGELLCWVVLASRVLKGGGAPRLLDAHALPESLPSLFHNFRRSCRRPPMQHGANCLMSPPTPRVGVHRALGLTALGLRDGCCGPQDDCPWQHCFGATCLNANSQHRCAPHFD